MASRQQSISGQPGGFSTEEMSPDELKRLKREAQIRQKEEAFERKRQRDMEQKAENLQKLREEFERNQRKAVEDQLARLKRNAELRYQKKAETARLNARREERMAKKHAAWKKRADAEIKEVQQEQKVQNEQEAELLQQARDRKKEAEELQAMAKAERAEYLDNVQQKRVENWKRKEHERFLKMVNDVDRLKTEAQLELESFIQNPYPVPLKQVLAGRLRPVPRVTELLAKYKDQKEDLEDLDGQDVQMRATLRNQSLFSYVSDLRAKADQDRIKPPEPVANDIGRGVKAGKSKSPQSRRSPRGGGSPDRTKGASARSLKNR